MSWNLPPGVSLSDIPGNRPQEIAAEELLEKLEDFLAAQLEDFFNEHELLMEKAWMDRADVVELWAEEYVGDFRWRERERRKTAAENALSRASEVGPQ